MYDTILFPTDGAEEPTAMTAEYAQAQAEKFGSTVHIVCVQQMVSGSQPISGVDGSHELRPSKQNATEHIKMASEQLDEDIPTDTAILQGKPAAEIMTHAQAIDADLIIMGTHGRTGIDRMLVGSVTEKVVKQCEIPVLVLNR